MTSFTLGYIIQFASGSQEICQLLQKEGYWADFIDPSSGTPVSTLYTKILKNTNSLYSQYWILNHVNHVNPTDILSITKTDSNFSCSTLAIM